MPSTETTRVKRNRGTQNRSAIGNWLAKRHAVIRHRLARWMLRRRLFLLYVAARTWPHALILGVFMQTSLRVPESPRLSITLKVLLCVSAAVTWLTSIVLAEKRWKQRKH